MTFERMIYFFNISLIEYMENAKKITKIKTTIKKPSNVKKSSTTKKITTKEKYKYKMELTEQDGNSASESMMAMRGWNKWSI